MFSNIRIDHSITVYAFNSDADVYRLGYDSAKHYTEVWVKWVSETGLYMLYADMECTEHVGSAGTLERARHNARNYLILSQNTDFED